MGHVYLLRADRKWQGKNLVKIGMTNKPDVSDRILQIQREWANERAINIEYISSFETRSPTMDESELHRKWQHRRLYNQHLREHFGSECSGDSEWFAVDNAELRSLTGNSHNYSPDRIPWAILGAIGVFALGWLMFSTASKTTKPKTVTIAPPGRYTAANIRTQPSPTSKKVGQPLVTGTKVSIVGRSGDWLQIDCERRSAKECWVAKNFVRE